MFADKLRKMLIPYCCYLGITLVVPLVNTGIGGVAAGFWNHALVVVLVPLIMMVCGVGVDLIALISLIVFLKKPNYGQKKVIDRSL